MDIIKRIYIENIKGKEKWKLEFDNLTANQPNIIVAPNGYGKSTLAVAFKASSNGRLKLNPKDYYMHDENRHPKLEIELLGEHKGIYTSTDIIGDISKTFTVFTINSPLYAKNTTKGYSGKTAATADLRVEDVVIFDRIPQKQTLEYSYSKMQHLFGEKRKLFINLSTMLSSIYNVDLMLSISETLKKCCTQKSIQKKLYNFLSSCNMSGNAESIKASISDKSINELYQNPHLKILFETIEKMKHTPNTWQKIDIIFTAIQICVLMNDHANQNKWDILKKTRNYLYYKKLKEILNARLNIFNTTGRVIKTHEKNQKLLISFERANSMSNGERDILSFISKLTKFEVSFNKEMGILVIDEVFDYLDGSNLLAVQYYLSELIDRYRKQKRILFPIILTHLDPQVFSNYYFKNMKTHYISCYSNINLDSLMIKLLKARECPELKDEIEKYYIHFNNNEHLPSELLTSNMGDNFNYSNQNFKELIYNEVRSKYLSEEIALEYDPAMVITGVRLKIEELVYNMLTSVQQEEFISIHKVINKLKFADSHGVNIPELYYLLQPLYNDGMHLHGKDDIIKQKIKSSYLKTNNMHIRRMIKKLFE